MIDITIGSIDIGEIILSPTLSADQFKNSVLYNDASLQRIYTLKEPKSISGRNFIISLYFFNGYLKEIHLYMVENNDSEEWSEDKESSKKKRQDEWLKSSVGKGPYKFSWGNIESLYDPKGGFSLIIIRYK